MILTIGNIKGGVGKTTLAVNIAIARAATGADVLLIDADEQGSADAFTRLRTDLLGEAGYSTVQLFGKAIRQELPKLKAKYADIIIDVGGRNTESLRAALLVSDRILIPIQPSSFDVWSFDQIASLVQEARVINDRLQASAVLNAADAQGHDNAEAQQAMTEVASIETLPTTIVRRKAFRNAAAQGRGVLDMLPRDPKAADELTALIAKLYEDHSDIGAMSYGYRAQSA